MDLQERTKRFGPLTDSERKRGMINTDNDSFMINEGLRQPKVNIDRTCFMNVNKNKVIADNKHFRNLKDEFTEIILKAKHVRFNVVFKPINN